MVRCHLFVIGQFDSLCKCTAGKDLPQMLRCSWQETLPVLETVPFAEGSDIPSQAAAYSESHPDLEIFESVPVSTEEALREAARLNAEKAISIAERSSAAVAPLPETQNEAAQPQGSVERAQAAPQGFQTMPSADAKLPALDRRTAIEQQLMSGAGEPKLQATISHTLPEGSHDFTYSSSAENAPQIQKIAATMPEGRRAPPQAEARALSSSNPFKRKASRLGQKGSQTPFRSNRSIPAAGQDSVRQACCDVLNLSYLFMSCLQSFGRQASIGPFVFKSSSRQDYWIGAYVVAVTWLASYWKLHWRDLAGRCS